MPFLRTLALTVFMLAVSIASASAQIDQTTSAEQAILVDAQTGAVLLEKNANEKMPTSSMSKTMTMYMLFEALKQGRVQLDTKFVISEKAWKKGGSKMFIEVGDEVKVEDLIQGVVVQSGNDAAIAVAEGLAGSEEVFAQSATRRAHELGMTHSNFANASGWPDENHYSTARDLAILAFRIITDFPEYYHYFSEKEFTYNDIKQDNRNPLLYRNMGVDGIKTGHTEDGGYGLMASGVRDGRRLILVVNGLENEQARASEPARLLEWGFGAFENVMLYQKGDTVENAEVWLGESETVPLVIDEDLLVTVPKAARSKMKVTVRYEGPLAAPVAQGQKVGTLRIEIPGMETLERDLIVGSDVPELGIVPKTLAKARYFILGAQ